MSPDGVDDWVLNVMAAGTEIIAGVFAETWPRSGAGSPDDWAHRRAEVVVGRLARAGFSIERLALTDEVERLRGGLAEVVKGLEDSVCDWYRPARLGAVLEAARRALAGEPAP